MLPAIVFVEGSCGNFLANFLFSERLPPATYRIVDRLQGRHCFHLDQYDRSTAQPIIKILPVRRELELFFHLAFSKKEELSIQESVFASKIDRYIQIMRHYLDKLSDLERMDSWITLSLTEVLDTNRCAGLYVQINGSMPDDERLRWAQSYIQQQVVDRDNLELKIAYKIFGYELDNRLESRKRKWSISDLTPENAYKLNQLLDLTQYS